MNIGSNPITSTKTNTMGQLTNLEGLTKKSIDALFIQKGSDIEVILMNDYAATAANYNGAINIWKDDEGNIRCESMRYFTRLETKIYKKISPAIKWTDKWLIKIK
jgi:hypothetical protein